MAEENKNIGSDFDDFLQEESILEDVEIIALKRVISYQIELVMKENHIPKSVMAKKMCTSRSSLDRLLDPENVSVTLQTLGKAAKVLGRKLTVSLA
ncbi:MAG: XRE family transcriptional regulator [Desulfuromonas sp.]|nr:XRE family transcriptional regulator [Desulfuromonas sp.]